MTQRYICFTKYVVAFDRIIKSDQIIQSMSLKNSEYDMKILGVIKNMINCNKDDHDVSFWNS